MRHTYFSRLFLSFLGMTFLFVVMLLTTAFSFFSGWISQYSEQNLRRLATLGVHAILDAIDITEIRETFNSQTATTTSFEEELSEYLQARAHSLGQQMEARVTLIASDGKVIADSDYDPRTLDNHGNRNEVRHAFAGESFIEKRWSTTQKQRILYIAVPIPKRLPDVHTKAIPTLPVELSKMIPSVLRIAVPMGHIESELHYRNMEIFLVSLPIWLGTLLVGAWLLSRYFAQPMRQLAEDMRSIAHGNLNTRLRSGHSVEFQEVDESVHSLIEEIRKSYQSLEEQRHTLENILNAIREPILVMDSQANISFANSEFHCLCCSWSDDHTSNQDAHRLLHHPDFDKLLQTVDEKKNPNPDSAETIFEWDGKTILARVGLIPQNLLRVCTFSDVTQVIELANIKRDLVNSVSHELRTPLAAIQGFVEMLQDDEQNDSRRHYLEIIHRHCMRLSRLIDDLLTLGEIENKCYKLEYAKVNLSKIVGEIQILLESRLHEKALTFESEIQPDLTFEADPFRMEQMLLNLLDNAAKYTMSGSVGIRAKREGQWIQIEVHDTGIGMTEKDCQRIFDRFYVADKSRSRRLGGTGLGLSIVKHIVLLHHGQIIVKSQIDIGTTFRILLPATTTEAIPQGSPH